VSKFLPQLTTRLAGAGGGRAATTIHWRYFSTNRSDA